MKHATLEFPPLSPREYIAYLCTKFGKPYVTRKFGVTERTVERWMAQEKWVGEESVRKGPVEKYEETLHDCINHGHVMEARAMVARQAKLVGCELVECDHALEEPGDWRERLLEDLQAFSRFHEAVRLFVEEELDDLELAHQYDVLVRELRRTLNCVKRRLGVEMHTLQEQQRPYRRWKREAAGGGNGHRDMAPMHKVREKVDPRGKNNCPICETGIRGRERFCSLCGTCLTCL